MMRTALFHYQKLFLQPQYSDVKLLKLKTMKKLLKSSILFTLFLGLSFSVQAQKFGYVNSAAILAQMPEVKQAESELDALQKQYQKKGQVMVEKLQADYVEIQKKVESGQLSPVQQQDEAKKLEDRQKEIATFEQEMVSKMQEKRNELLQPIYDKVNKAISDVAKEGGFQMIFDQQVLLYSEESQDISAKVKSKLGI